jgi:hypothetical protein
VLVRVAGRERHGHDAAKDARPEGVDEGLQTVHQDDRFRLRRCANPLQVPQDAQRAFAQVRIRHAPFLRFAGDEVDPV